MTRRGRLVACASFGLVLLASGPAGAQGTGDEERRSERDGAVIPLAPGYEVFNNAWNKEGARGPHEQSIFARGADGGITFGWQWRWPAADGVVAYPEVIFGDTPWNRSPQRRAAQLPFAAGSRGMTVDYDITLQARGIWNMAFELWTISGLPVSPDRIRHEVMIWIDSHDMTPAGVWRGKFETGGVTWDLFLREGHGDISGKNPQTWTYIAFLARRPVLKGPLDVGAFVDFLLQKKLLDPGVLVTSLELGSEIVTGSGSAEISTYRVTIK